MKQVLCGPCTYHWLSALLFDFCARAELMSFIAQDSLPEYLTRHSVIHDYLMQYQQERGIDTGRITHPAPSLLHTPLFSPDANPQPMV